MEPAHEAALQGNAAELSKLIQAGSDVNDLDIEMRTPLHCAVEGNSAECVKVLVSSKSIDLEVRDLVGATPLFIAARDNKLECVQALISAGANVNATDDEDNSPLHKAAFGGSKQVVAAILDSPAVQVNLTNRAKQTPLHVACEHGQASIVQSLIRKGADINAVDRDGQTPLHTASQNNHTKTVKYLLKKGANPSAADGEGALPIHVASWMGFCDILKVFIEEAKQDPNIPDAEGMTPLLLAAEQAHIDAVVLLLNAGAKPDASDLNGEGLLHKAASSNKPEFITAVAKALESKEDKTLMKTLVNSSDIHGTSPLHIGVQHNAEDICRELLKYGANPNGVDEEASTPLHKAASLGFNKIVDMLMDAGASATKSDGRGTTAVHLAALNGHNAVLATLARHQTDLALPNEAGQTPLYAASSGGYSECVRVLLMFSSPEVILATDNEGNTALHAAAEAGHDDIVRSLIQNPNAQFDINAPNHQGFTPLMLALKEKHLDTCRVIIAFGGLLVLDKESRRLLRHIPADKLEQISAESIAHSQLLAAESGTKGGARRSSSAVTRKRRNTDRSQDRAVSAQVSPQIGSERLSAGVVPPRSESASASPSRRGSSKRKSLSQDETLQPNATSNGGSTLSPVFEVTISVGDSTVTQTVTPPGSGSPSAPSPPVNARTGSITAKSSDPTQSDKYKDAVKLFETKPEKGINAFIDAGFVQDNCTAVASFLFDASDLNKAALGDFLSMPSEFAQATLDSFMEHLDFKGLDFDVALRRFLFKFRLPGEAQKIDRLMQKFANRYYACNPGSGPFHDADAIYVLAFSTIMLNTDAHNPNIKTQNKMTKAQFLRNNSGINGGQNFPDDFLSDLYDRITLNEIKMESDDDSFSANAEAKGWLEKQGVGRIKTWKRKWFVLTENCLFYFNTQNDKEPAGIIPLENVVCQVSDSKKFKNALELRSGTAGIPIKATSRKPDGGLVAEHLDAYIFQAATEAEAKRWVDAIDRNIYRSPFHQLMATKKQQQTGAKAE